MSLHFSLDDDSSFARRRRSMPPKLDGVCLSSSGSGTGGSGGSGGGGGSCQQFALQVMMRSHHHTFLSSAGGDVHDQDVQLQRALQEQKVTITQLNLAELELYGRDRELDVLQEALEEVLATGTTTTATVNATATANAAASKLDANASISSTTTNTTTTAGTTSTSATSTAVAVVQPHPLQVSSKTTPPPILLPRATTRGVVSIVGRAGTGKTRLTQEFKNTILKRRKNGLFLRGKFDLQNRKEPYAAVAAALSELPHQLESKGSAFKDKVWKRIQDAVGNDSHILTSLVPELSCVLGIDHERVPTDQFNYANLSHRLNYIFRQFMRALCCPDCPVVMVLDDMQWTDSSSLALVNTIIADPRLSSFLLVTTCREEEIGDKHIFVRQLQRWQDEDNIPVRTIAIGNLNQSAVSSIVSTALRSSEEKTLKLSEIVHQKTDGNAWYAIQFLRTLYDDGLLRYNLGLMQWMWEETMVRSQFVMDNVVDLAAAKIRRLPPDCQNVLQIASCLGRTFDLDHLEFVLQEPRVKAIFDSVTAGGNGGGSSEEEEKALAVNTMERHWPDDLVVCLKELVQESVIDFISQLNCYCFVHDLIQEAAFHLIPQSKSAQIQNEVGRCLLRSKEHLTSKRVGDQYYFRAIDLSNAGSDMLDDHEMLALAKCNLEAGEKAMEQAAFPSALKYMEQGFRCLGPEAWSRDAELALRLESGAVEAAYCCGDFESMEVHMASVLDRDDLPIHDKVRVYLTRILSYGAQDRNLEALQVGRKVLREMKVTNIPLRPTTRHLIVELLRTKFLLRNHTPESLLALPKLESKKWLLAMSVVDMMTAIAYVFDINVFTVMNLRTLRWSVTYGVCRYSPTIFSTYGVVLSSLGDVKIARMYGDVAISLSQRLNARASVAKTIVCIYGLNYHWTSNLRICLKPLMYGHKVGMESGEVEIAMYSVDQHGEVLLVTAASPLQTLVPKLRSNASLMREHNQEGIRTFTLLALQFAMKLMGPCSDPHLLSGDVLREDEARANITAIGNQVALQFLEYYCLQLAYYFEDYVRADRYRRGTKDFAKVAGGHFLVPRTAFFQGLTALALAGQGIQRRRNLAAGSRIARQLRKWTESGNVNCIHTLYLLEAEMAAVRNRRSEAVRLYWKAVNTASRNGYLNDKALAHERAFLFHLRTNPGDLFWAQTHFNDAVQAYCDWNAYQKARQLVASYGNRFDPKMLTGYSIPAELEPAVPSPLTAGSR